MLQSVCIHLSILGTDETRNGTERNGIDRGARQVIKTRFNRLFTVSDCHTNN